MKGVLAYCDGKEKENATEVSGYGMVDETETITFTTEKQSSAL